MRKKIVSVFFALVLLHISAYAHTAVIEVSGENRYKAIRLTPQIYNAANRDLSDLLIKDSGGENVPYFINTGLRTENVSMESYSMELIQSYVMDNNFYFDYKLADERSSDTIATSVAFVTGSTNFAKAVDVYGSYDNLNWEFIQHDKLYAIDDKAKLSIEFVRPEKYTHYRFKLANNLEKISFDAVDLIYSMETSEETYFIENLDPKFSIENDEKRTEIIIEGLKNLRLCDIAIHSDSMFKRMVIIPDGIRKELYNLALNGTAYADMTIPLQWQTSQDEMYVVAIMNEDDKPININGVTVRYYADEAVFEGVAGEAYTLEFGADPDKTAPVYDIERYKNEVLKGSVDKVAIGEIHYTELAETPPERDYKLLFNIVVIAIALLLSIVILLKLKQK